MFYGTYCIDSRIQVLYGILLVVFTVYVLLDTFVIARTYTAVPQENSGKAEAQENGTGSRDSGKSDAVITANSYEDDNVSVVLTEYREYDTDIYVAEDNNAILAVNGDYYGARERGYVLRNGVLYRETVAENQEDLVIYEDGSFEVITEEEVSAEELLEKGAYQILSFGPGLVVDGEISVTEKDEVGRASASNPRTAIGRIDELHYVVVVSDGRTRSSEGLSLYEMAHFSVACMRYSVMRYIPFL